MDEKLCYGAPMVDVISHHDNESIFLFLPHKIEMASPTWAYITHNNTAYKWQNMFSSWHAVYCVKHVPKKDKEIKVFMNKTK